MSDLVKWDNFYVIVGSAAGALIGLQFVVLTLVAERPSAAMAEAGAAYGSPTIVHFGVVLFLSALLHAPWQTITVAAAIWGILGFGGVVYVAIIARRMRKPLPYTPIFEDWLFHCLLPLVAYAMLAFSAFVAPSRTRQGLFWVGGAALLLLFASIHNAWDSVSYHVFVHRVRERSKDSAENRDKAPSP